MRVFILEGPKTNLRMEVAVELAARMITFRCICKPPIISLGLIMTPLTMIYC